MRQQRLSNQRGRRRGVVIIITLLALILLASLVFYVLNLGRQVNRRVVTQNAADAAAMAGAGWVARSLNTVAMNNVGITHELAALNVLQGLPLATDAALDEQTFFRDQLRRRLSGGIRTPSAALNQKADEQFGMLLEELEREVERLEPVDRLLNQSAFDMRQVTFYRAPGGGRGDLWRAMEAMDQLSQATLENGGALAQVNAVAGGRANLPHERGGALLLPVTPAIPWVRGRFADFERPLKHGELPESVPEDADHRGPYDVLFGYRRPVPPPDENRSHPSRYDRGANIQGPRSPFEPGPSATGAPGGGNTRAPRWRDPTHYYTWGAQAHLRHEVEWANRAWLNESRWERWTNQLADAHLGYCWDNLPQQVFSRPLWRPGYPSLSRVTQSGTKNYYDFSETGYFQLEIRSKHPRTDGSFLAGGTWAYNSRADHHYHAMLQRRGGWWLPSGVLLPSGLQVAGINVSSGGNLVWLLEWEYSLYYDYEIGILPVLDDAGNMVRQKAYFYQIVAWAGLNTNPQRPRVFNPADSRDFNPEQQKAATDPRRVAEVADPYQGLNRQDAPAPVDLDHKLLRPTPADRQRFLTFLGIARQNDQALAWPSKFDGRKPYPYMVGLAQAQVFNNHSWDLWTQMWHAQLAPVRDYDHWVAQAQVGGAEAGGVPVLARQDVEDLRGYLHAIQPLAGQMMRH